MTELGKKASCYCQKFGVWRDISDSLQSFGRSGSRSGTLALSDKVDIIK